MGEGLQKGRQGRSVKGKGSADGRCCEEMVGWRRERSGLNS